MKTGKHFLVFLILPLIGIALSYHGLALFSHTFKWDPADQFLPLRMFASQCLHAGIFPAWCPYIYNGYSSAADPSLGIWYVPVWLAERFTHYGVFSLQSEMLIHLLLSGWGFGFLLRSTGTSLPVSAFAAAAFPLGGFVVFHLAHYPWIISLCWGLWYTAFLYRICFTKAAWWNFFGLSAALALELTGGYPFFHFLLVLLTIVFVGKYKLQIWSQEGFAALFQRIWPLALSLIGGVLLSFPYLFTLYRVFPQLERASGLSAEASAVNPFPVESLLSFIFPGAALFDTAIPTDLSMKNSYGGLLLIPMLALSFYKYNLTEKILFFTGLFFLLLGLGNYTPLYSMALKTLPILSFFRHTGIFVSLTYVLWLLLVFRHLENMQMQVHKLKWFVMICTCCFGLIYFFPDRFIPSGTASVYPYLRLSLISSFMMLTGLFAWSFLKKYQLHILGGILLTDLMIQAAGFQQLMVEAPVSAHQFQQSLNNLPKDFPVPPAAALKEFNHWGDESLAPMVHNASLLKKTPAYDGFNSFYMKAHSAWEKSSGHAEDLEKPLLLSNNRRAVFSVFEPGKMIIQTHGDIRFEIMQLFDDRWKVTSPENTSVQKTRTGMMEIQLDVPQAVIELNYQSDDLKMWHQLMLILWMIFLTAFASTWSFRKFKSSRNPAAH